MLDSVGLLLRWLAAQDSPELVVISCAKAPAISTPPGAINAILTGCIAQESDGVAAQILAVGARQVSIHTCGIHKDAETKKASIWKNATPGLVTDFHPTRKRLFRQGKTISLPHVPLPRRAVLGFKITSPIDFHADDQERTAQAIEALSISDPDQVFSAPKGVQLDANGCTLCGVCVKACKNDALQIQTDTNNGRERVEKLVLSQRLCRGCHSCIDLCPVGALEATQPQTWRTLQDPEAQLLFQSETRKCKNCGARIKSIDRELCALCVHRQENPFQSVPLDSVRKLLRARE
ncbi:4Fe-4S dicluster domain-containing protein [Arcanobacterium phocisimile]|uniref:4Fe-4S dicluster domain-containing protein n=1 Tax=Arcanobacterium phocisimile TaxID=1302235 RepID=A0ABX7IG28_9ACTO|nr:4Fe-4S dicluster domain-containing protein [Arcanobacterium phocisimile]QRV01710.1 4Fe-4S dicluster domain-containing protein [Arcanobacterium phocisimile]